MGAVPCLEILGNTDGIFLPIHVAAKFGDGPRLHDVPHILAVLGLGQVVGRNTVGQRFLAGIDAEGQGVARCGASLIVGDCHRDQIAACVLGGAAEGQAAADGRPEGAGHAAAGVFVGTLFCIGHNGNGAFCDIAGAGIRRGVQLFPIRVSRNAALFCPSAIDCDVAVLIGGGRAGGTGNAVIVLLSHNGGLKVAHDLYMKLIEIALTVIFYQGGIAIRVDEQLHPKRFVAGSGDGDHIAALQYVDCGRRTIVLCGKDQTAVFRVLLVAAAAGGGIALGFPYSIVDGNLSDGIHIAVSVLYGDVPVIAEGVLAQGKLLHGNGFHGNQLEYGGDGYILSRHLEGAAGVGIHSIHSGAVCLGNGNTGKHIALIRCCGDGNGLARLSGLRGDGGAAVFTVGYGDGIGHGGGIDYGGGMGSLIQRQRQILIAIGGDDTGGGIDIVSFTDHKAKIGGIGVELAVVPYAVGVAALTPCGPVDGNAGN